MNSSRRKLLTVTLVVFLVASVAAVGFFLALNADSGDVTDGWFRDHLLLFVGFMLASTVQFICLAIYGEDVWRHRQELMSNARWWLLIALVIGGPWIAIPAYWWHRVHRDRGAQVA